MSELDDAGRRTRPRITRAGRTAALLAASVLAATAAVAAPSATAVAAVEGPVPSRAAGDGLPVQLTDDITIATVDPARVGRFAYFSGDAGRRGAELYRTSIPGGRVSLVADVRPNGGISPGSSPSSLFRFGRTLLFAADDGTTGREPWVTDTRTGRTRQVGDLDPGSGASSPSQFTEAGGRAYFVAFGTQGYEVYVYDPASRTASVAADVRPGAESSGPQQLTPVGDDLYFTADAGLTGREVWRIDTTTGALSQVTTVQPGLTGEAEPDDLTALDGAVYFTAGSSTTGSVELWRADESGAQAVTGAGEHPASWDPSQVTAVGDVVALRARSPKTGAELWRYDPALDDPDDPASDPVGLWADLRPGRRGSLPITFTAAGSTLYLSADGGDGQELWRTDAATGETEQLEIQAGRAGSGPNDLTVVGQDLFLSATDGARGREPWHVAGPSAPPRPVANLRPGRRSSDPANLTAAGDLVLFNALPTRARSMFCAPATDESACRS